MAPDQADLPARVAAAATPARAAVAVFDFAAAAAEAQVRAAARGGVAALAHLRAAKLVAPPLKICIFLLPPRRLRKRIALVARNERRAGRRRRQCDAEDDGRVEQ